MRAFLLIEEDGTPVAEGVEFTDGGRVVKWLDGNMLSVYGTPVESFDEAWELVWVTDELTVPQLARYSNGGSGPIKIEGFPETLDDLRSHPGLWKPLAVAEDELSGHALRQALLKATEEHAPGERFAYACGELNGNPFTVFGSFEPKEP